MGGETLPHDGQQRSLEMNTSLYISAEQHVSVAKFVRDNARALAEPARRRASSTFLMEALARRRIFRCLFLANKPSRSEHLCALFRVHERTNRTEHLKDVGLLNVAA
jgi:hypothetical protein